MSIKEKLREQTKKAHQEFRMELYNDVKSIYAEWNDQITDLKLYHQSVKNDLNFWMDSFKSAVSSIQTNRDSHVRALAREVDKIKQRTTWGFVLITIFVSVFSSVTIFFLLLHKYGLL